jgi:YebC/PmpR family DNA-binding regulatory protein
MAGHSHWAGIKRQKGATDQKRAKLFSKLLVAIGAASRNEPNPDFNPRLRTAIAKAREANVPNDNISRAIRRNGENDEKMEELVCEAYGPGGVGIIIEIITSSRNRAVAEIKKILSDNQGKWAEMGNVRWGFTSDDGGNWAPKFTHPISADDEKCLQTLVNSLLEHDDVHRVHTNKQI